ncbi:DUF397 domain-containing protein [Streptomyces sp. NPDC090032]|uniref:DUF397 domain-containing protein n=1 Tax=Streptomyces sp. NPDC090032 TaxID=3365925 RepID=UPI0037F56A39
MNTELVWFKSSYSGSEGEACLEVALEWRKSTYSGGDGEACVEIATQRSPTTVHVRDSKQDPTTPTLTFSSSPWGIFLGHITAGGSEA